MNKSMKLLVVMLMLGVLLAACSPGAKNQDAMMDQTPTKVMEVPLTGEDAMMDNTATSEMMDEKPADAMMDSTATPEMMDEKPTDAMMDSTATPEMMDEKPTDAMMEKTPDSMMSTETPASGMIEDDNSMMAPAWFATELTNVVTGTTFKIEDFKGKVVLVETFAQWCPTCLSQQKEIVKLHEMLGMTDDLVTVTLDIDPNEDAAMLKMYLDKHGFDWNYAIAPSETSREIGELYGSQFLNPTSAPIMIIDRHGEVHPLPFGIKSAQDLQEALEPFLSEGM